MSSLRVFTINQVCLQKKKIEDKKKYFSKTTKAEMDTRTQTNSRILGEKNYWPKNVHR